MKMLCTGFIQTAAPNNWNAGVGLPRACSEAVRGKQLSNSNIQHCSLPISSCSEVEISTRFVNSAIIVNLASTVLDW